MNSCSEPVQASYKARASEKFGAWKLQGTYFFQEIVRRLLWIVISGYQGSNITVKSLILKWHLKSFQMWSTVALRSSRSSFKFVFTPNKLQQKFSCHSTDFVFFALIVVKDRLLKRLTQPRNILSRFFASKFKWQLQAFPQSWLSHILMTSVSTQINTWSGILKHDFFSRSWDHYQATNFV